MRTQNPNLPEPRSEAPLPAENPMTDMLREGGARRERSFAAVATSAAIHLSLAGVVVFASAFAVGPPPPPRTTIVTYIAPPPGPPPLAARKGVERPARPVEKEVKPAPVLRPPVEPPKMVVPSEPVAPAEIFEEPIGHPDGLEGEGDAYGDPDGVPWGDPLGLPGGVDGAPPTGLGEPDTIATTFEQARLISKVEPIFPAIGRKAGAQGIVVLEAIIDVDGRVVEVNVLRSVPLFDEAAMQAVRQWRFEPGIRNGRPVRQRLTVSVSFKLNR